MFSAFPRLSTQLDINLLVTSWEDLWVGGGVKAHNVPSSCLTYLFHIFMNMTYSSVSIFPLSRYSSLSEARQLPLASLTSAFLFVAALRMCRSSLGLWMEMSVISGGRRAASSGTNVVINTYHHIRDLIENPGKKSNSQRLVKVLPGKFFCLFKKKRWISAECRVNSFSYEMLTFFVEKSHFPGDQRRPEEAVWR